MRVVGAATTGNRILHNSITANGDKGIRHDNNGNHLMPPPVMLAHDGTSVSGNVANLSITPPGSIIQVFTDPDNLDPEGDAFFGQAIVQSNGTWKANGVFQHPNITMTATHGGDGSTSEFGTGGAVAIGFQVSRTDNTSEETISPGANRVCYFETFAQSNQRRCSRQHDGIRCARNIAGFNERRHRAFVSRRRRGRNCHRHRFSPRRSSHVWR